MYRVCRFCKQMKLWFRVRPRKVMLPIGIEAQSQDNMCGKCHRKLKAGIK